MRTIAALTLFVSLAGGASGQNTGQQAGKQSEAMRQIRKDLSKGDYGNAERRLKAALSSFDSGPGADVGDGAEAVEFKIALADLMREEGRDSESRAAFAGVLAGQNLSWVQRLDALTGLAGVDGHTGRTGESLDEWKQAVAIARDHQDSLREAAVLRGMAMTWLDAADPSQSVPLLKRSVKLMEDNAGTKPWDFASVYAAQGEVYRALGKNSLAEEAFTKALELDRGIFGEVHPQPAFILERLAMIYSDRKEFELARHHAELAAGVMRTFCGDRSLAFATALAVEGDIERNAGSFGQAVDHYQQALEIADSYPDDALLADRIARRYAAVLKTVHREREAKTLLSRNGAFHAK